MNGIRVTVAIVAATLALVGCTPQDGAESTQEIEVAAFNELLADLVGPQAEQLSDGQRWRLVASTGTGLPPSSYRLADLPEPGARGAALQQVYCIQCHGVASPRMHTAEEWPILLRRMFMRARTLHDRLGGRHCCGSHRDVWHLVTIRMKRRDIRRCLPAQARRQSR